MEDVLPHLSAALSGRYRAVVYLAQDLKHDRRVAIKVMRPDPAISLGAERFLHEIQISAKLNHPHILPLHDSGEADGVLYFVMPFVEGQSLREKMEREGQLELNEALEIARELADGLGYAHGLGIIHRDVKAENVLLSEGHAIIADFGIARALATAGGRLTRAGSAVGSPLYMSPEQAAGQPSLDGRSDLYSLACVLHEMLAGEPPFPATTPLAALTRPANVTPPSIRLARPTVPEAVELAIHKALERNPADRFQSAAEFSLALVEPASRFPPSRSTRINVWIPMAGVLGLLLLAWAAISLWTGIPGAPELDPNKVVVFPLADRGGGTGEGTDVAFVIYWALEHTGPLRWVNGWRRLSASQRENIESLTELEARDIAVDRGAGYFIDGAVVRRGDSVSVALLLHDTEGDSTVAEVRRIGHEAEATADRLGLEAMIHLLPPIVDPERPVDLSYLLDRDPAAIALWIQGEREYRQAHWASALELYQRAVSADSNLSFAAVKGAQAAGWAEEPESGHALVEVALSSEDLLPPKYRAFGRAFLA